MVTKGENTMPTIVHHYDKKTGKTRVYESTPHYDPVTKQSRPKRKYLGTLDDETGELIPSSGRRGRRKSPINGSTNTGTDASSVKIDALLQTISDKDDEIASLKSKIKDLQSTVRSYQKACTSISNILRKASCEL